MVKVIPRVIKGNSTGFIPTQVNKINKSTNEQFINLFKKKTFKIYCVIL